MEGWSCPSGGRGRGEGGRGEGRGGGAAAATGAICWPERELQGEGCLGKACGPAR